MILLLSLLSGAAGLVYEVLWAKWLAIGLGGAAVSQAVVLAAFLGGLAAGGAWLGLRADRASNPLLFFARLELSVALWGLVSPFLLRALAAWTQGPLSLRTALGALLVFLPCVVMGGAVPALARAARDWRSAVAPLYAVNCLGAAAGALAAGFVLIPGLGLVGAVHAAAGVNLAGALIALAAVWRGSATHQAPSGEALAPGASADSTLPLGAAWGAAFVAGTAALACETAWTRLLALAMGSSAYSFAVMLAGFILGAAAGGLLLWRGPLARAAAGPLLGGALAWGGLAWILSPVLAERLPYWYQTLLGRFPREPWAFHAVEAVKLLLAAGTAVVPAALVGMAVPAAARGAGQAPGAAVGRTFAFNCAGCVLGAWAGLLLMPRLGADGLSRAAGLASLGTGILVLLAAARPRAAAAALVLGLSGWFWGPRVDRLYTGQGGYRNPFTRAPTFYYHWHHVTSGKTLLYYKDDREATVSAIRYDEGIRTLKVNGKADASTGGDMATQILLAELPLILKPGAKEALVVGWGSGVTVGSVLRHPVELVDAVELNPAVVEASRHFATENGAALKDPRLRLFLEDARRFIHRGIQDYDLIVSEPSNPWMAGVGGLFTAEFYDAAAKRLKPGGLMVQWCHFYEMDDETFALILRTFLARFPHAAAWSVGGIDALLVGSQEPLPEDFLAMHDAYDRPGVAEDLARARVFSLPALLSLQAAGGETLRELAGPGPLNREERPLLEYRAPKAFFLDSRCELLLSHHDAKNPRRRPGLYLRRYLAARPFPLTATELKSLVLAPRDKMERFLAREWLAEWRRRYPRDPARAVVEAVFKKAD